MTPKTVWAVYFSGTGTTERTVRSLAGELALDAFRALPQH